MSRLGTVEDEIARTTAQLEKAAAPERMESQLGVLHRARDERDQTQSELDRAAKALGEAQLEEGRIKDELRRKLSKQQDEADTQKGHHRVIRMSGRVRELLSQFQTKLLASKLHQLEALIAERFQHLSRKDSFVARVAVNPDSFALSLFDEDGERIDKRRMSAGEQQLLAVSFLWALAINSGRNLPVVIDTPLSRMDSHHRDNLVERYFPHASHQVILLSTDVEIDQGYHQKLMDLDAISQSLKIQYDPHQRSSTIEPGYFW